MSAASTFSTGSVSPGSGSNGCTSTTNRPFAVVRHRGTGRVFSRALQVSVDLLDDRVAAVGESH